MSANKRWLIDKKNLQVKHLPHKNRFRCAWTRTQQRGAFTCIHIDSSVPLMQEPLALRSVHWQFSKHQLVFRRKRILKDDLISECEAAIGCATQAPQYWYWTCILLRILFYSPHPCRIIIRVKFCLKLFSVTSICTNSLHSFRAICVGGMLISSTNWCIENWNGTIIYAIFQRSQSVFKWLIPPHPFAVDVYIIFCKQFLAPLTLRRWNEENWKSVNNVISLFFVFQCTNNYHEWWAQVRDFPSHALSYCKTIAYELHAWCSRFCLVVSESC